MKMNEVTDKNKEEGWQQDHKTWDFLIKKNPRGDKVFKGMELQCNPYMAELRRFDDWNVAIVSIGEFQSDNYIVESRLIKYEQLSTMKLYYHGAPRGHWKDLPLFYSS